MEETRKFSVAIIFKSDERRPGLKSKNDGRTEIITNEEMLGHIIRCNLKIVLNIIIEGNIETKNHVGRPRLSYYRNK